VLRRDSILNCVPPDSGILHFPCALSCGWAHHEDAHALDADPIVVPLRASAKEIGRVFGERGEQRAAVLRKRVETAIRAHFTEAHPSEEPPDAGEATRSPPFSRDWSPARPTALTASPSLTGEGMQSRSGGEGPGVEFGEPTDTLPQICGAARAQVSLGHPRPTSCAGPQTPFMLRPWVL
jgi:hypothetical protein